MVLKHGVDPEKLFFKRADIEVFEKNEANKRSEVTTKRKKRPSQIAKDRCKEVAKKLREQNPVITIAKAIPHLVASSSYYKGCRAARISRNTFYEWLKIPVFKDELKRQRDSAIEEALETLKSNMTNAVKVLLELLDETKNEYLKRNVAKDIIGYAIKAKEIEDLDKRITEIENSIRK